ncbi:related to HST4 - member of the Sir2p family of NAD(+)-dependent histone deacetylases [Melanopsichium pennsylvanicum]|uniref:Related to HST4 - member of the Sir2p family of NAD(+)-dependent histone deacetylases n=2 Tax=Melanopsichium pennsylvanicum TaxID=63383 RepID=A0AAJ4XS97_9BASI|nr:related to HST4-member of the Sir2p family of NAD()-dependent histone deacetylases [Melanopsichium pennsylvanicum 4]SNX86907.1 related to HST4 - member of the Sir2p family of NAD(+)-dependent histone deacetylases [Melanopsichium pennsylvanicum]
MIVINIPVGDNVQLPPEPRPRPPPLEHNDPSPRESSSSSSGTSTPGSGHSSRRLSRRVQSMAVVNVLRDDSCKPFTPNESAAAAPSSSKSTSDLKALKYDLPADIAVPSFALSSKDVNRDLARLYEAVSGARRIAVICGAGISVSSPANIPDFRSAHGLFKKLKEKHPTAGLSSGKDLFDARLFSSESTSALFYSMVAELKRLADEAEPTIFHRFLKRLDDEGRLQRVYTQNIDGLEEKAGLTFGLGEAGDSTTTVRALGKRKRLDSSAFSRSKSDSHLLFVQKQQQEEEQQVADKPMFPRTIPLHGTLQTLTCALCNHKLILGNTVHHESTHRGSSPLSREGSASLGHEESKHAIELLQNGEAVPCPKCTEADEVRTVAGMRSRGVGRMKVDIVLYGGQNEGAERVGQCLQRDILGLRDPNEPPVPESAAETRARERKEKKEAEKLEKEQQQRQALEMETEQARVKADISIDSEGAVDSELGTFLPTEYSKDDILARAFAEEGNDSGRSSASSCIISSQPAPLDRSITIAEPTMPPKKKAIRPPRLKPLPPDLLIVAGTSLKVPGTKRIVREFAKACHAQDEWLIYSSEDEDDSSTAEDGLGEKRAKDAKANGAKPKKDGSTGAAAGDRADEDQDEDLEIHDPSVPIRTILLNYDFPNPSREWEDVFDVWIQGDLQRAALSLFPPKKVDDKAPADAKEIEEMVSSHTWAKFRDYLEEQRKLIKKEKKKAAAASTAGALGSRKGKLGRTVSAAPKLERTGAPSSIDSTCAPIVSSQVKAGKDAAKAKFAKARSRSESPVKKRPATITNSGAKRGRAAEGGTGTKNGLKRSNSKRNPFLADTEATSLLSVEIPTIAEEEEQEERINRLQGKEHDDGNSAGKRKGKELPSSSKNDAPLKKRSGWVRSATMPEKSQVMVLIESQATNGATGKKARASIKDVGMVVKSSPVYGAAAAKGRKRGISIGAATEKGIIKSIWSRVQSETSIRL